MGVNVRERPKGSGVWWVFINHNGKRKAKKIGNDEKRAHDVAEKIKARLVLGELKIEKTHSGSSTLRECAETWLALPHPKWKRATKEVYENNLRIHVYPKLGKRRIDRLERKELKTFFDHLLIKGLNHSTAISIKAIINGVLKHALDSDLIDRNPLSDLKLEKGKKREIEPLTEDETPLLLEQAKRYCDGKYYPHLLCLLRTGIRVGELQGLKWDDIDFEKRFIDVRRSYRKKRVSGTKSGKSRLVDMSQQLTETLSSLRLTQKKKALKQGRPISEWVFPGERAEHFSREALWRAFNRCLELAGLPRKRIHDLRHTYGTVRLLKGHNIGDVSYQMGHSTIRITYDTYGHWKAGKFKAEVDELDETQPDATQTQPEDKSSGIS
jgi:integrase